MNNTQPLPPPKTNYAVPTIEIIQFSCADIITTSGNGDPNQGEWDPQFINDEIPTW